ncbi:MAG TPA: hypothetical protein VJ951_15995 [Bacteroidales bacterium]|nr:hypothetical protein [Bacteroidales bacterium]
MKTQMYKRDKYLASILLAVMITIAGNAQTAEKMIEKSYAISKGFTLEIDNEYGETNIVNWDKDELSVVITITTEAGSQSKAEKMLERISVDIDERSSLVSFDTEIENMNASGTKDMMIIYDVKTPSYINATLEQSYGSMYIQELSGYTELEVKYGSLNANALYYQDDEKTNALDLAYGEADLAYVASLSAEVKYSKLSIDESETLILESAYSKYYLGNIVSLDLESKYDKLDVVQLSGSLILESAYTNVNIDNISEDFSLLKLDMKYGNFKGNLASPPSFEIDAFVDFGSIDIPEGNLHREKDGLSEEVIGTVGSGDGSVTAELKYGNLTLR